MKIKTMMAIMIALAVTITLLVSACDTRTGPSGFQRPPFTPGEGEGWAPTELLDYFGMGDWTRPAGVDDVVYIAYSLEYNVLNTVVYGDYLHIEFESSTQLTLFFIRSYLQRTFPVIEIREEEGGFVAGGWKWHSNSLIYIDITISTIGEGDIRVARNTSNGLRQGWPSANDLAIFDVGDFTRPSGIENQYNIIFSGNDRYHLYSLFKGDISSFLTHFRNYFEPRATLMDHTHNRFVFRKIVGNTIYEYTGGGYEGYGDFEFRSFASDLTQDSGTGWPTSTMLNPFKLGDWEIPEGLEGLTWLIETSFHETTMIVYFTQATEASVDAIRTYLETKAPSFLDYIPVDMYGGYYEASDEEYFYYYNVFITLFEGGNIILSRFLRDDSIFSEGSIENEHDRVRNPFKPNRDKR